jgi:kumamolisin
LSATVSAPRVAIPYRTDIENAHLAYAHFLGHKDPSSTVELALTLPLQNQDKLQTLLKELYDPGNARYHHWITPSEFAKQFGTSLTDYNAVIGFAAAHGLKIVDTSPTHTMLLVSGSTSAVESAFGTRLNEYKLSSGRVVYGPESQPTLPAAIAGRVNEVAGLDNIVIRHAVRQPISTLDQVLRPYQGHVGNGPAGGLSPADLKKAYNVPNTYQGDGQTAAVYELDGYLRSDIDKFTQTFSLPSAPLNNILVDNYNGNAGGGAVEVVLDIDMILGMAPHIQTLYVYEAPNTNGAALDEYNRIANDNLAKVLSISWGLAEDVADPNLFQAENSVFEQMASQGQSVYDASGDSGAYDDAAWIDPPTLSVDDPASQPLVTGVGGTSLQVMADGTYNVEDVWQGTLADAPNNGGGSGGGISSVWPKPDYQVTALGTTTTTMREVPDVAVVADPNTGCDIYVGGWFTCGGTSMAAPIWAGFTTLVNQRLASLNEQSLGAANPILYPIAHSNAYGTDFHDVIAGNNLYYNAGPGYDDATGWGSFVADKLLIALASPVITSLSPSEKTSSSSGFTLTINGVGFDPSDTVKFGSDPLTPTSISSTQIVVNVPAGEISGSGPVDVTVVTSTGASSMPAVFTVDPVPAITGISPLGATAGHPDLPVVISGRFASGDVVNFGSDVLTPTKVTSTSISVTIPAADLATPATVSVSVTSFDGVTGPSVQFVVSPAPTLTQISPNTVQGGHPAFTLTATGTNFVVGDSIKFGSDLLATTVVSSTELQATVPSADLVTGAIPVLVETPDQLDTASLTFTVTAPPTLTSISPTSAMLGSAAFVLTLTGSGFSPTDTVLWNGVALTTTYVSATQLTAHVPSSDMATAGTFGVNVQTAVLGQTATLTFTVNNPAPTLTSISPTSAPAGSAAVTLTVNGTNFVQGSTVQFAGADLATTYVSATKLTATIPSTDLSAAGEGAITVTNPGPGGGVSTGINFRITGVTTIYGLVSRSFDNAPVNGAVVTLTDSNGNTYTATSTSTTNTGADGKPYNYVFTRMPGGTFTISLSANGYTVPSSNAPSVSAPNTGSVRQDLALDALHVFGTGLQMMSAPNDFSADPITASLPDLATSSKVITWDASTGLYVFAPNAPADSLHPGRGYWAVFTSSTHLVGPVAVVDPNSPFAISLSAGWNLIGDPFPFAVNTADLRSGSVTSPSLSTALISPVLYTYNPATNAYDRIAGGSLQPYAGYWVYALKAGTLLVYAPGKAQ